MTSIVELHLCDGIAEVAIFNPPNNTLSHKLLTALYSTLEQVTSDPAVNAIVLYAKGPSFSAGNEIVELVTSPHPPSLLDIVSLIENCQKITVAALHGEVFGGALEIVLACSVRLARADCQLGLPDVAIGLLPSAGATWRLPRLIGVDRALKMITSGRPIGAADALQCGLIDALVEIDLAAEAVAYIEHIGGCAYSPVALDGAANQSLNSDFFMTWRTAMERRAGGQIAPQLAVDAVEYGLSANLQMALGREAELGQKCRQSSQSDAMQYAALAESVCGVYGDPTTASGAVSVVGIVGAGTMGAGIAMAFASANMHVILVDVSQENLQKGLQAITTNLQRAVASGRMDSEGSSACWFNIQGSSSYDDLQNVDLVVEAAFEDLAVKQSIFAKLDRLCAEKTLLATNTSYLDVDAIAAVTQRPEKILGMHFFSPANIMPLLEVVAAAKTSSETLATVLAVAKRIDKVACVVGVCFGFVGNRMYSNYSSEANLLLLEGAQPWQVDAAMRDWGMAMGPLAVADMSGLDIGFRARQMKPDAPTNASFFRPANMLVEEGRLGQKSAAGFYRYRNRNRERENDNMVSDLIEREADRLGITRRSIDGREIQQRLIYTLINEGARILDQGIARCAGDIDVIWINGYGFPRWRGGPMYHAGQCGLQVVVDGLRGYYPSPIFDYQQVSPRLLRMAEAGENFVD